MKTYQSAFGGMACLGAATAFASSARARSSGCSAGPTWAACEALETKDLRQLEMRQISEGPITIRAGRFSMANPFEMDLTQ